MQVCIDIYRSRGIVIFNCRYNVTLLLDWMSFLLYKKVFTVTILHFADMCRYMWVGLLCVFLIFSWRSASVCKGVYTLLYSLFIIFLHTNTRFYSERKLKRETKNIFGGRRGWKKNINARVFFLSLYLYSYISVCCIPNHLSPSIYL